MRGRPAGIPAHRRLAAVAGCAPALRVAGWRVGCVCLTGLLLAAPALALARPAGTDCEPIALPESSARDLDAFAFVVMHVETGRCASAGALSPETRHAPWSSFKIPHFLIALESGAATAEQRFVRDARRFPAEAWWSDAWREPQTLEVALRRSTVWVYRMLTDRIAEASYRDWLARFGYGNREIGRNRDDFWLGGPLAISVREQVAFLAALVRGETGLSPAALLALDRAARQDVDFPLAVFGKTGAGPLEPGRMDGPFEGWFVGWLRADDGRPVAAFALYGTADSFRTLAPARRAAALALLREWLARS